VYGRDRELQVVSSFLAGAQERPAALVLQGEPGMGKTTLWRNGVDDALARGFDVLATTPASGETQLSFAVLSDLVGGRVAEVRDDLPAPQRRALEAALLLDEPDKGGEQPRTVFAATLTLLRALAERRPLLIAIDDFQWLDESSSEALAFCFRRFGDARISALLARRTDGRSNGDGTTQAALEGAVDHGFGPDVGHLVVGPLSSSALHDVISERLGLTFQNSLMKRIVAGMSARGPCPDIWHP
jgi:predicted ATPase